MDSERFILELEKLLEFFSFGWQTALPVLPASLTTQKLLFVLKKELYLPGGTF